MRDYKMDVEKAFLKLLQALEKSEKIFHDMDLHTSPVSSELNE